MFYKPDQPRSKFIVWVEYRTRWMIIFKNMLQIATCMLIWEERKHSKTNAQMHTTILKLYLHQNQCLSKQEASLKECQMVKCTSTFKVNTTSINGKLLVWEKLTQHFFVHMFLLFFLMQCLLRAHAGVEHLKSLLHGSKINFCTWNKL